MKALFTLVLMICTVKTCDAQSWRAIVKLGAFWNSASTQPASHEHGWPASPVITVGASRKTDYWELGATAGLFRYSYRMQGHFVVPQSGGGVFEWNADFRRGLPGFAIMPFVNRHFDTGRISWYGGLAPTYVRIFNYDLEDIERGISTPTGGNCFGLTLQGGCSYRAGKNLNLFAEPFVQALSIPGFSGRAWMFAGGITLGCRVAVK